MPLRFSHLSSSAALAVALTLAAPSAHAEPTSWLSLGAGYGFMHNGAVRMDQGAPALDAAIGVGTPATHPFVIGGVFRSVGYIGLGADISVSLRLAMQSYCVGDWGLAVDIGVGGRFWGSANYGQFPIQPVLIGGLPFGFQVAVGADVGDVANSIPVSRGGFAVLEFDFLRLTAMRSGATTKVWANPSPVNSPPAPTPVLP